MKFILLWASLLITMTPLFGQEEGFTSSFLQPGRLPTLKVSFPVNWEMIKTGFSGTGVAAESETYFEYWTFIQHPYRHSFLLTPRGKVSVLGLQRQDRLSQTPEVLMITENDLATLFGLSVGTDLESQSRVFFLTLDNRYDTENVFSFKSNQNQLINVSISLNQ